MLMAIIKTLLGLFALMGATSFAPLQSAVRAPSTGLTVIELFTSQGCSSCPPANDNLARLANQPDVLALSFGVDYWDYLGWRDTFANRAYTQRQRDYARGLHLSNVYTPQMVINGRGDLVGTRMGDIDRARGRTAAVSGGPSLTLSGAQLSIGATKSLAQAADIWLVRYDPRIIQVPIQRGENTGKTLPHTNVVRQFVRLGSYSGQAMNIALPAATQANLRTAILVQTSSGGPIIAAVKS
jgi:hypothetical protein